MRPFHWRGLFVGGHKSPERSIVSASNFTKLLLDICKVQDATGYDLDGAAEDFIEKFGEPALVKLLHDNFTSKEPTDEQKTMVCQPWYRIYTTNYDDLIEKIAHAENKALTIKEITDLPEPPLSGVTQLIHIYGNISRVSPAEFKDRFLLTERQRENSPFLKSAWKWRFSDDVLAAPANCLCWVFFE